MKYKLEKFDKYSDKRGDLVVFLKNGELSRNKKRFGQIYFVTFNKKGIVRGNHFHKKWSEWFGVIEGKVEVVLKDIRSGEQKRLIFDSNNHEYIRLQIAPYVAHSFKSLTKYAALLNYADSEWSAEDTFSYKLM